MNTNKRMFKLVAILTLLIVPASFVQARTNKRKPKIGTSLYTPAFTRNQWILEATKKNGVTTSLEMLNVRTSPSTATLLGATPSERFTAALAAHKAEVAKLAIMDTRPDWMKMHTLVRNDPLISLNGFRGQRCEPSLTVGGGIKAVNVAYTRWQDNHYGSLSVGLSSSDMSASVSRGMCEPSTGVFLNAALVLPANEGKVNSFTWYYGKMPSFERTYSTPNAGVAVGVTVKIWSGGS